MTVVASIPLRSTLRPTFSLLDDAIGGLGEGQPHIVLGPDLRWTAAVLGVLVYGSRQTWNRIHWIGDQTPGVLNDLPNLTIYTDMTFTIGALGSMVLKLGASDKDLIVIDNMPLFQGNGWAATAIDWSVVTERVRKLGSTLLLAGHEVPGKALGHQARFKLRVEELARVRDSEDSILNLTVDKCQTRPHGSRFIRMSPDGALLQEA